LGGDYDGPIVREIDGSSEGLGASPVERGSMSGDVVTDQDLMFLRRAIELAREARADGWHPFGSLIVNERGEVVVEAHNNAVLPKGDPTQHAELVA
jgi:hypothetical protein